MTSANTLTFTWDAWNRLVKISWGANPSNATTRAEYVYNGLNWRITKRADTSSPPDGDLNQERRMYYSANWQLLEEEIDDDFDTSFDLDRRMQYVWGTPGRGYIDDIIMRRQDSNDDGTFDQTWYHITDTLFSTVAILDDSGKIVERVSYDAYGGARHHRAGDLDGDGAADGTDQSILLGTDWGGYGVGDFNRDGVVGIPDLLFFNGVTGAALPPGRLSLTDNVVGYAGYIFNAEFNWSSGAGLYTVRHRHYAPDLGRWLSRDPIGYVDGMSLYEYVRSRVLTVLDAMGLFGDDFDVIPTYGPNDVWVVPKKHTPKHPAPPGPPAKPQTRPEPAPGSGVYVCHRPIRGWYERVPWWMSPILHPYFEIDDWTWGFPGGSEDDTGRGLSTRRREAIQKDEGTMMVGGKGIRCSEATPCQIQQCIKELAESGELDGEYNTLGNNCGTWLQRIAGACCLKAPKPPPGWIY